MIEARAAAGLPPNPHGQTLANISIIMCTIAGFLVICRLLTRFLINRMTGWDDYTLVASLVLAVGMTICFNMEVYYGMGLHTSEVDADNKVKAFLWLWVAQLLYKIANGMTKISIILLYLRIFPSRKFKLISWGVSVYVVAYCTAAICTSIWQCDPISKAWRKTEPGKCIDIGKLWYANSVFTILADVILIVLPLNQIIRLKLPMAQKIALSFVFSLGVFVMACTIIRCVMLGPTTSQKDSVYYQAKSNSWTFLEVDVSIVCAALPILKAPLQRLLPRVFGVRSSSDGLYADSKSHSHKKSGLGGGTQAFPLSNRNRNEWQGRTVAKDDTESDEERILSSGNGIVKTTNVSVGYEEVELKQGLERKKEKGFEFALKN